MVSILMMSAKMVTLGILQINAFRNKTCDVIISVRGVINKNLLCNSNFIVEV